MAGERKGRAELLADGDSWVVVPRSLVMSLLEFAQALRDESDHVRGESPERAAELDELDAVIMQARGRL